MNLTETDHTIDRINLNIIFYENLLYHCFLLKVKLIKEFSGRNYKSKNILQLLEIRILKC